MLACAATTRALGIGRFSRDWHVIVSASSGRPLRTAAKSITPTNILHQCIFSNYEDKKFNKIQIKTADNIFKEKKSHLKVPNRFGLKCSLGPQLHG